MCGINPSFYTVIPYLTLLYRSRLLTLCLGVLSVDMWLDSPLDKLFSSM